MDRGRKRGGVVAFRDAGTAAALKASEEKYRTLVRTSPDAITITDLRGRITEVSDNTVSIHGYSRSGELIGKNSLDLIAPGDRAAAIANMKRAYRGGRVSNVRYVMLRRDGSTFTAELSASLLKGHDGKPYGFIAATRDVTHHLRDDARLKAQYDIAKLLSTSTCFSGCTESILTAMCNDLGFVWGEFWELEPGGKTLKCTKTWHAEGFSFPALERRTQQLSFEKGSGFPGRIWGSGRPLWIPDISRHGYFLRKKEAARYGLKSAFAFPILRGSEVLGVFAFLNHGYAERDMDLERAAAALGHVMGQSIDRERAEDALKESEAKYHSIVEHCSDLIMINGPDGTVTYASPACESVLGYKPQELVGGAQPWIIQWLIHPEDLERVKGLLRAAMRGESGKSMEYRIMAKHGDVKWVSHSWTPIMSRGKLSMIVSVVHDITARKKSEAIRREIYRMIELELEKRTKDLRDKQAELERKNKLLEEFKGFALNRGYELDELKKKIKLLGL